MTRVRRRVSRCKPQRRRWHHLLKRSASRVNGFRADLSPCLGVVIPVRRDEGSSSKRAVREQDCASNKSSVRVGRFRRSSPYFSVAWELFILKSRPLDEKRIPRPHD